MKYVILRCEDRARITAKTTALLEGAKAAYLQELAQAGAAGLIRAKGSSPLERFHLHRGLLGVDAVDAAAAPGGCYAAGADVTLKPGETAWCCELVTRQDDTIIDPIAGNIKTKESELLISALNEQFGSDARRWVLGNDSHHIFITREEAIPAESVVRSPDGLLGRAWKRSLPKGKAGKALQQLIEEASKLLDAHAINQIRMDLGENPANMIWCWGATGGAAQENFKQRTGLSGAVFSSSFALRGLARSLGMDWKEGPSAFEETPLQRLTKNVLASLEQRDLAYVHLRIESGDPVQRLIAMERIDQLFVRPVTESLAGEWRFMAVVDDRARHVAPVIAMGEGLPRHPVVHLKLENLAESPLKFDSGAAAFAWLIK